MIRAMHVRLGVMRAAFKIEIKTRREPNYNYLARVAIYTFIL